MGDTETHRDDGHVRHPAQDASKEAGTCMGVCDERVFGFLLIQNNFDYVYFTYRFIGDSPKNEPGTLNIRCGSSLAIIEGQLLYPIYNAIAKHRLLWLRESDPIAQKPAHQNTFIESIQIVPQARFSSRLNIWEQKRWES